jgi:hypothetical protein
MTELLRRRGYTWGAIAILAGGVAVEAVRLVAPWPGFVPAASETVSVALMVLWASTAIALPLRNRRASFATLSRILAVAAAFAMLAHAAVTRVGGSYAGLGYLVGAALLTVLFVKIFSSERDPETREWLPHTSGMSTAPPSARHAGP